MYVYARVEPHTRFTCRQCSRGQRRRCQSTTHRPLKSRCGSIQVLTQHGSDAGNMLRQYAPTRVPQSHTAHIWFPGPSNVPCTRYVPLFPGGDAAGQSQVRSESDRAGSAEPAPTSLARAPIAISRPSAAPSAPSRSIGRPRRLHAKGTLVPRIGLGVQIIHSTTNSNKNNFRFVQYFSKYKK